MFTVNRSRLSTLKKGKSCQSDKNARPSLIMLMRDIHFEYKDTEIWK